MPFTKTIIVICFYLNIKVYKTTKNIRFQKLATNETAFMS